MPIIPLTHANIINLLGIESLPLDERKEIVMKTAELIEARVFNRVMNQLESSAQEQLTQALEKEDEDMITQTLEENEVDILVLSEEEIERVKHEFLGVAEI